MGLARQLATDLVAVLVAISVAAAGAIAAVRAIYLPATSCLVTKSAVDAILIEETYEKVTAALGCDGVLASRDDWGEVIRETYLWRGDAWPFGRLHGDFFTRPDGGPLVLHKTEVHWLNLYWRSNVSSPSRDERRDGATAKPG